jgi:hypothetical protein
MTAASNVGACDVPTMPGGHRVLGHVLEFGRDPLAFFQRAREHGDVVRVRFGPFRVYVLNSPSAIRQALMDHRLQQERYASNVLPVRPGH